MIRHYFVQYGLNGKPQNNLFYLGITVTFEENDEVDIRVRKILDTVKTVHNIQGGNFPQIYNITDIIINVLTSLN